MKSRFYTPEISEEIVLSGDEFHHAVRVARCRIDEEVECFDGRGRNLLARVASIDADSARLEIIAEAPTRESTVEMTLAMALIHPDKFELVLQKGCELGVTSFRPLITSRTEVRPERVAGKRERWLKILLEATKQSGRSVLPRLHEPMPLRQALVLSGRKIVFDLDEEESGKVLPEATPLILFIGPEGGFSPEELAAARAAGAEFLRLGPRRLRAETAAIAAVVVAGADLVRR